MSFPLSLCRSIDADTSTAKNSISPCFVWIVFIAQAAVMAPCWGVTSVQWVITAHLGLGPGASTHVQLDLSTPTLGWENPRTVRLALQVTHHLLQSLFKVT